MFTQRFRAGSEEGRLFSQAKFSAAEVGNFKNRSSQFDCLIHNQKFC